MHPWRCGRRGGIGTCAGGAFPDSRAGACDSQTGIGKFQDQRNHAAAVSGGGIPGGDSGRDYQDCRRGICGQ